MKVKQTNRPTPQLHERVAFVNGYEIYLGTVVGIEPVRVRWDDGGADEDDPWPVHTWPDLLRVAGASA